MSRGLTWFIGILVVIIVAVSSLFLVVRSSDGPMEIISGGPFTSGETTAAVSDWSFLQSKMTIELQTMLPPRSRTMWLAVHDNRLYVVSRYMNTLVGKIWKQWPHSIAQDNRAIVRADGKLYPLLLERQTDSSALLGVMEVFNTKYNTNLTAESVDKGNAWVFELVAAGELAQ